MSNIEDILQPNLPIVSTSSGAEFELRRHFFTMDQPPSKYEKDLADPQKMAPVAEGDLTETKESGGQSGQPTDIDQRPQKDSETVPEGNKKPKQFRSKKPKDMPRRPLSAYNLFFKEERARMLVEANKRMLQEDFARSGGDFQPPARVPKIGFERMAKTIAKRWKELPKHDMERYKAQAANEMKWYRLAMEKYKMDKARRNVMITEQEIMNDQPAPRPLDSGGVGAVQNAGGASAMANMRFEIAQNFQQATLPQFSATESSDPYSRQSQTLAGMFSAGSRGGTQQTDRDTGSASAGGSNEPYGALMAASSSAVPTETVRTNLGESGLTFQQTAFLSAYEPVPLGQHVFDGQNQGVDHFDPSRSQQGFVTSQGVMSKTPEQRYQEQLQLQLSQQLRRQEQETQMLQLQQQQQQSAPQGSSSILSSSDPFTDQYSLQQQLLAQMVNRAAHQGNRLIIESRSNVAGHTQDSGHPDFFRRET